MSSNKTGRLLAPIHLLPFRFHFHNAPRVVISTAGGALPSVVSSTTSRNLETFNDITADALLPLSKP
ncbi:hypothetical protein VTK26DRAFT_9327 [Humicola hyalothermophila]